MTNQELTQIARDSAYDALREGQLNHEPKTTPPTSDGNQSDEASCSVGHCEPFWIWSVSVRWADWEATLTDKESDAYDLLQTYIEESENDGDYIIAPEFKKILVTSFEKVCPWHGCELTRKDKRLHCQGCEDDGGDPHPEYHSFTYTLAK